MNSPEEQSITVSSDKLAGLSAMMALKYKLDDPGHVTQALAALVMLRQHQTGRPADLPQRAVLIRLRSEYEKLTAAARNIKMMTPNCGLATALLAIIRVPDITVALHTLNATTTLCNRRIKFSVEPRASVLPTLMLTLGLVWAHSKQQIPSPEFVWLEASVSPVPGTCSAFIVEGLRATGWSWSVEQIAESYRAMQEAAVDFFKFHGAHVEHEDTPGTTGE